MIKHNIKHTKGFITGKITWTGFDGAHCVPISHSVITFVFELNIGVNVQ